MSSTRHYRQPNRCKHIIGIERDSIKLAFLLVKSVYLASLLPNERVLCSARRIRKKKKTSNKRYEECQQHDHFSGSSMLFEMSDINISPTLFPQLYPIHMRSSFDGFLHRCSRRCRRRTASFSSVGFVTDLLMHYFVTTTVG